MATTQFRSGSPSPSASNSDHSLSLGPSLMSKRKPDDGLNTKPNKFPKPTSNIQNLPFDPFNPHPGMSKEERKLARMIRNRTAAQASRDRKKEHVAELENRVRELEEQVRILSRPQAQLACLRPCCQQSTPSEPAEKPSTITNPPQTNNTCSTISPDSIDPSIIQFKPPTPASSSSPQPRPIESTHSLSTLDPQLNTDQSPSISPAQAEYLSKVRIDVLEEENIQLKSQLDYQLKKDHLLKTTLSHHNQGPTAMEIDQGMIEMILKDDETDKNQQQQQQPSSHSPAPLHLPSSSSASSASSGEEEQLKNTSPSSALNYHDHPDQLSQLSWDWHSLLLDRTEPSSSSSPTTNRPSMSSMEYHQHPLFKMGMMKNTTSNPANEQARKISEDWPLIDRLDSPDSSSVHTLEKTQPETPPPDQQPQAPSDAHLALSHVSTTHSASHHRLVAREVNQLSLQRNGWEAKVLLAHMLDKSPDLGTLEVSALCPLMMPTWPRPMIPIAFLLGSTIAISNRLLLVIIMACCLISCWVAWKILSSSMAVYRPISPSPVSLTEKTRSIPRPTITFPIQSLTSSIINNIIHIINDNNKKKKTRPVNWTIGRSSASPSSKPTNPTARLRRPLSSSSKTVPHPNPLTVLDRSIFIGWG